jgi:hypothetical protein
MPALDLQMSVKPIPSVSSEVAAGCDADLEQRGPEAVAGLGVVMPEVGGSRAGRRADEDEAKVRLELVGKTVHAGFSRVG